MHKFIPFTSNIRNFRTDDRVRQARTRPEAILSRLDYRRIVAEILG